MLDPSVYRVIPGETLDLASHDPGAKTGFERKKDGRRALPELNRRLAELQELLWADSSQALLVVLQAIDTGGKDGTIKHVFAGVNPQGVHVANFKVPSKWEAAHDYLWRVHQRVPEKGAITLFNRSHYEDVLVVRLKNLVPEERWSKRYHHIREFERLLTDEGTRIVKFFLNISKDEQRQRLQSRLDEPSKHWKFDTGDLEDRALWDDYQEAFRVALEETSTDHAPWFVVPANRKWYRNLVVSTVLIETLESMGLSYPKPEVGLDQIVIS
jgi:PPK2 family polyphosphate:nucleotide phosphotransferase